MAVLLSAPPVMAAPAGDPLAASPKAPWNAELAAHLLRRAGFGGTPEQIERLTRLGRDRAVDLLVDYETIPQTDADFPADALMDEPPRGLFAQLDAEQRMRMQQVIRQLGIGDVAALQDWWLRRMVQTPRPLEEKMTLFWHGHFTSGFREVRRPRLLYRQNEFLRRNALGDFRTLLMGISRDAAMLAYLDNGRNVKERPNENYARELMELFSMGEGHYGEQDVKAAARAFTGWTAERDGRFVIRSGQHDDGEKTFLGRTGNFDGDDVVNIILEQPATSRFLARKLWRFFVEPEPAPEIIEALAEELRSNDFDLRETLRVIFRSDAFYAPKARFALIKSPAELLVTAARQLDVPLADLRMANQSMSQMGQELFQPPNVKGWDGGRTWITTSTLFIRYNIMKALLEGTPGRGGADRPRIAALLAERARRDDGEMPGEGRAMMELPGGGTGPLARLAEDVDKLPEPARQWLQSIKLPPRFSQAQPPYDPAPVMANHKLRSAEEVVDHYVRRLLAMPLPADRRRVLIETLEPLGQRFDPAAEGAAARIRAMIHLVMSMPEYQLN